MWNISQFFPFVVRLGIRMNTGGLEDELALRWITNESSGILDHN